MNFGEQFKKIRTERNLTQEQTAEMLSVSRQAVSNWENDRNLPDIEMLVAIAKVFRLSLDSLLLNDENTALTRKLIKDGSETRRARFNLIAFLTGAFLVFTGFLCLVIKALSYEFVDEAGILHENFFLLPVGFLLVFCGVIVFTVTGIKNFIGRLKNRTGRNGRE